jgi:integrase
MPWRLVPAFVQKLRTIDSVAARGFEFLILTAGRSGEVLGAVWPEVNLDEAAWIIPARRTKADREHRVPLAPRAVQILKEMQRLEARGQHVFPSINGGLGESAFQKVLKSLGHGDVTVHGFRSSFRDWAGEATSFPREICEAALAHATGDAVERAYRRGDALEKRRKLMASWAQFLAKSTPLGTVVPMRKAGV